MKPTEQYFLNQKEPYQSIMLYIRSVIFKTLPKVEERYSYKIPFYYHNKKALCYLNVLKNTDFVDIAFVQGFLLENKFPQLKDHNNRKQVRSLQIKRIDFFDERTFSKILKEASNLLDKSKRAWNP
jgi:hypothetical protein